MYEEKLDGLSDLHRLRVVRPGFNADGVRDVTLGTLKQWVNEGVAVLGVDGKISADVVPDSVGSLYELVPICDIGGFYGADVFSAYVGVTASDGNTRSGPAPFHHDSDLGTTKVFTQRSANYIGITINQGGLVQLQEPMPNLSQLYAGAVSGAPLDLSFYAEQPQLTTVVTSLDGGILGNIFAAEGSLPLLSYFLGTGSGSAYKDGVFIGLELCTRGSTATGTLSIDIAAFTGAVTAASLAARNALIARGWTLFY